MKFHTIYCCYLLEMLSPILLLGISLLTSSVIIYNCRPLFCCLHPFLLSLLCNFSSSLVNLSLVNRFKYMYNCLTDFLFSCIINFFFFCKVCLILTTTMHLTGLAMFCCMPTTLSSGVTLTQVLLVSIYSLTCNAAHIFSYG